MNDMNMDKILEAALESLPAEQREKVLELCDRLCELCKDEALGIAAMQLACLKLHAKRSEPATQETP